MLEADRMGLRVEIDEIAAEDIDRADAKAHLAGIDTIEIDQCSSVARNGALS
jgi:hypothetical protein